MPLKDHFNRVPRLRGTITTVDPSQRLIEISTADGNIRRLAIFDVPSHFTWPKQGEEWGCYEENGYWYLGNKWLNPDESAAFEAMQPGEGFNKPHKINVGDTSGYRIGRSWLTNFQSSDYDQAIFTVTNMTWQADPANATIQTVTANVVTNPSSVILTDKSVRNVDVRIKYRVAARAPYGVANNDTLRLFGRYLSANNNHFVWKRYALAYNLMGYTAEGVENYNLPGTFTADPDITNTTRYRYMRFQIIEDMIRHKAWFAEDPEPEWFETYRMFSDGGGTGDMIPQGGAGFQIQYGGAYFSEMRILELVPNQSNILINNDASEQLTDPPNQPAFWQPSTPVAPQPGNSLGTQVTTDQYGNQREVFHVKQAVPEVNAELLWRHIMYNPYQTGKSAWSPNRARPTPLVSMPKGAVEVSVWSKGENISLNGGDLATRYGAIFVIYYWDEQVTQLNVFPEYFALLGPNTDVYGPDGGAGTWDWTETRWRMPIHHWDRWVYCEPKIGMHNKECTGELWWTDPVIRPCS